MHQTTPGVERAVAAARARGAGAPALAHFVLALLEEDEGRPAVLLERAGLNVAETRGRLEALTEWPAPPEAALFDAARAWSLAHRHDPEFLTDALLLAVLNASAEFRGACAAFGLDREALERVLVGPREPEPVATEAEGAAFQIPDASAEVDAGRALDANFNRAREAARVLEDYCRFACDDRFLTEQVKALRHGLAAASQRLPVRALLAARDTQHDVGTTATAGGEYDRASPLHVAAVNAKRLQEALRSLEEFGKVFGPELGRELEALRYRAYTLERAILTGASARERLAHARLYVLLTRAHCSGTLDWTIAEAARGGASVFQLREKNLPDRELLALARRMRAWTRAAGALFIVNDRPDVARLCDADGVHVGQDDASVKDARRVVGPYALVGVSTHTIEQVRAAVLDGADYIGVGPTFPSKTKAFDVFPGLDFVRAASAETALPAFALGGISHDNVAQVVAAGGRRVAVSAAVCAAPDPEQAARLLRAALPD
jgi:thiamine-phosphate pyrophosphorylase